MLVTFLVITSVVCAALSTACGIVTTARADKRTREAEGFVSHFTTSTEYAVNGAEGLIITPLASGAALVSLVGDNHIETIRLEPDARRRSGRILLGKRDR